MLYTQNNATGEGQGPFANTTAPYFDSLYCRYVLSCLIYEVHSNNDEIVAGIP